MAFFTEIGAPGRLAQNLDDQNGTLLKSLVAGIAAADHLHIRIVETGMFRQLDVHFGVAAKGTAGLAAQP